MVDVVRRTHRDRASARACCVLAIERRRTTLEEVRTDTPPADVRVIRAAVPGAAHTQRGLHRAKGPDTPPIARSHVPTQDRLRPRSGRQSIRMGQRVIAGVELARAVRRGHVAAPDGASHGETGHDARARAAATTFLWLAGDLRIAA